MDRELGVNEQESTGNCYACRQVLPRGVSFCVACGKHNLNPDAGAVATGKTEMAAQKSRDRWKQIKRWFQYRGFQR